MISLSKPFIGEEEINAVIKVLKSGWLAHGPKTKEFEEEFAKYIGVKKAISLNSCTSALQLAIQAQNLKGGIIVPSFTFVASANAIITAGCKPVFVDIEYNSCNINPEEIKKNITKDTVAIMPVHFAGQSCKMKEIMEIAEKHDLRVIEDSAETVGGTYNNKKTGSFDTGCFSFYPVKNMTCGEGGMITTNNEQLAKTIATLKAHGIDSSAYEREKKEKPWLRAASLAGYNFRLCDVLSIIGLEQLKKLDKMNEMRIRNASYLNKNINVDWLDLPKEEEGCKHVYQMYTVKVKEGVNRNKFISKLKENDISVSVHFDPPVHLQPYYHNKFRTGKLDVTEKVANSIVTLPMYPQMTEEELEKITNVINFMKKEDLT